MLTSKTFPWLPLWRHTKETTTSPLRMTSLFSNLTQLPKDENLVSIQMHLLLKLTLMNTFNIELFKFKNTFSGRCRYNLDIILRTFLRGHFNLILHKLSSTKGTSFTGRAKPRCWHDAGVQACAGGGLELSAFVWVFLLLENGSKWKLVKNLSNCKFSQQSTPCPQSFPTFGTHRMVAQSRTFWLRTRMRTALQEIWFWPTKESLKVVVRPSKD